ncbi:MAG: N-acetyltransferase [Desulfobacterales bacterium]
MSTGLKECKKAGIHAIVVLGHPDFYPRFGFVKARKHGIQYEYDVPDNLFMTIELKTGSLSGMSGIARYHDAFKKR